MAETTRIAAIEAATTAARRRRDLAAEVRRGRELRETAGRLRLTTPLLRALTLRGASDGPLPAPSEPGVETCGVCRLPIRAGESRLYRGSATVHLDCAFAPADPDQIHVARSATPAMAIPRSGTSESDTTSDYRCSLCGRRWRGTSRSIQCPSCLGAIGPDGELVETLDRRCVACACAAIERIGMEHSIDFGPIRALHRCRECAAVFILLRPRPK